MAHMPAVAPGSKPGIAPMWVTVPMWMPPGSSAPGIKPDPSGPGGAHPQAPFPFAMPFFNGAGAMVPGHPMANGCYPGLEQFSSLPTVSPASSMEDQDLPTHAPCA